MSHRALGLDREHPIEVFASAFAKRDPFLGSGFGELSVELGNVVLLTID